MSTPAVSPEDVANADLADDATAWDKRMQALTLRNMGATYAKIGEQLYGGSTQKAKNAVQKATAEVVQLPVDQMVNRQRSILLDITRRNYPRAMDTTDPEHREAQGVIIRCLEHEAKLFGLYAPQRVQVGISETEFGQQAAELLAAVGPGPLAELAGQDLPVGVAPGAEAILDVVEVPLPAAVDDPWSNL